MDNPDQPMPEEFEETINRFLGLATNLESELSVPQIHSAFLYASSCYTSKHLSKMAADQGITNEAYIDEMIGVYRDMIENGVNHYD